MGLFRLDHSFGLGIYHLDERLGLPGLRQTRGEVRPVLGNSLVRLLIGESLLVIQFKGARAPIQSLVTT